MFCAGTFFRKQAVLFKCVRKKLIYSGEQQNKVKLFLSKLPLFTKNNKLECL